MSKKNKSKNAFNKEAAPDTPFFSYLKEKFGRKTAQKVHDVFQKMNLQAPVTDEEFMKGTEGALAFLNPYGVVIRIEYKDFESSPSSVDPLRKSWGFDRVNDTPWILQPLASIDAGKAFIEVCPGCDFQRNEYTVYAVRDKLKKDAVELWDESIGNIGLIPVKTPSFPTGVSVVIDRLAVKLLTEAIAPIKTAVEKQRAEEAAQAIEELYVPLRESFDKSFTHGKGMASFWKLCEDYVRDGKLVAGWNTEKVSPINPEPDLQKTISAKKLARAYEARLLPSADNGAAIVSSGAAVPRSPYRPA